MTLKPPIHWYGGKTLQTKNLLPFIPEHHCYVEPYGGSGALLFAKEPSKVEVYNDLHKDVVNLYAVIRNNFEQFSNSVSLSPYSRSDLNSAWLHLQIPILLNADFIARARDFFIVARQSFSARHNVKPGWSSSKKTNHALAWMNAIDKLPEIHERLRNVQIECRPALEVMRQYDEKQTFHYLDPPYLAETRKETKAYEHEMDYNDHFAMLCLIKQLKGMVLLSGYHHEVYDDVLAGWRYKDFIVTASAIDTTSSEADTERTETIWWNDALEINRVGAQMSLELEV